jgi:GLPGLI family protein
MKYLFALILITNFGFAQTGIINYGEVQSMGMGSPVGPDYNSILIFNQDFSLYITRQDSIEGGHRNERYSAGNSENQFLTHLITNEEGFRYENNLNKKYFRSRDVGFNYVHQDTPKIDWEITNDFKDIGGYTCVKAITNFIGRKYTAWFTMEIPLPYGPWKLQGLPGMILEAYDTNKEIYWYFKAIKYPSKKDYLLKPIKSKNDKWISYEKYSEKLIYAFEKSIIAGRMVSESAGIQNFSHKNNSMSRQYIEVFDEKLKN